jgi:hypothetical protein
VSLALEPLLLLVLLVLFVLPLSVLGEGRGAEGGEIAAMLTFNGLTLLSSLLATSCKPDLTPYSVSSLWDSEGGWGVPSLSLLAELAHALSPIDKQMHSNFNVVILVLFNFSVSIGFLI